VYCVLCVCGCSRVGLGVGAGMCARVCTWLCVRSVCVYAVYVCVSLGCS